MENQEGDVIEMKKTMCFLFAYVTDAENATKGCEMALDELKETGNVHVLGVEAVDIQSFMVKPEDLKEIFYIEGNKPKTQN